MTVTNCIVITRWSRADLHTVSCLYMPAMSPWGNLCADMQHQAIKCITHNHRSTACYCVVCKCYYHSCVDRPLSLDLLTRMLYPVIDVQHAQYPILATALGLNPGCAVQAEAARETLLRGPLAFPQERLLSYFWNLLKSEGDNDEGSSWNEAAAFQQQSAEVFMLLRSLVSLRLLTQVQTQCTVCSRAVRQCRCGNMRSLTVCG